MKKNLTTKCILILFALSFSCMAVGADWSDTYISYMYGPYYKYPGTIFSLTPDGQIYVKGNVPVNTVEFTHSSGYRYGVNFLVVRFLNPAGSNNPEHGNYGQQPSKEVFGIYRHTLSFPSITGKKLMEGFIRDYGIDAGFNFSSNNNAVNSAQFSPVLGPTLIFRVPGLWKVALLLYKEYNNNRFAMPAKQSFKTTLRLESAWSIEVPYGKFKGFLAMTGPKGRDTAGVNTKLEFLTEAYYMLDIGQMVAQHKDAFYAGLGGQYWYHKFGTYNGAASATVPNFIISQPTLTPVLRLEAHF